MLALGELDDGAAPGETVMVGVAVAVAVGVTVALAVGLGVVVGVGLDDVLLGQTPLTATTLGTDVPVMHSPVSP